MRTKIGNLLKGAVGGGFLLEEMENGWKRSLGNHKHNNHLCDRD